MRLSDLEAMAPELGRFAAGLGGYRYAVMNALRQCLDAGVRWRLLSENPARLAGRNPQPPVVEMAPFTVAEVDAIAVELGPAWGAVVTFAAETGLRPSEWIALERRDLDRRAGVVLVERTFAGGPKAYGKTARSRRRVPLTDRALTAVDELPSRLDSRLLFPSNGGTYLDLHNWRSRDWHPALEAAGIAKRGPYALRHTYATWALRAGLGTFDVRPLHGHVRRDDRPHLRAPGRRVGGAGEAAARRLRGRGDRRGRTSGRRRTMSQTGQVYQASGKWGIRFYNKDGTRVRRGGFANPDEAQRWFNENAASVARERPRGETHHRWNGGRQVDGKGYVRVLVPGHPNANPKGYVYEHRLVMAQLIGRPLRTSEVVHHINGERADNRPENLALLPRRAGHVAIHLARKGH